MVLREEAENAALGHGIHPGDSMWEWVVQQELKGPKQATFLGNVTVQAFGRQARRAMLSLGVDLRRPRDTEDQPDAAGPASRNEVGAPRLVATAATVEHDGPAGPLVTADDDDDGHDDAGGAAVFSTGGSEDSAAAESESEFDSGSGHDGSASESDSYVSYDYRAPDDNRGAVCSESELGPEAVPLPGTTDGAGTTGAGSAAVAYKYKWPCSTTAEKEAFLESRTEEQLREARKYRLDRARYLFVHTPPERLPEWMFRLWQHRLWHQLIGLFSDYRTYTTWVKACSKKTAAEVEAKYPDYSYFKQELERWWAKDGEGMKAERRRRLNRPNPESLDKEDPSLTGSVGSLPYSCTGSEWYEYFCNNERLKEARPYRKRNRIEKEAEARVREEYEAELEYWRQRYRAEEEADTGTSAEKRQRRSRGR
jgi:hypothetical protein